MYMFMYMYILGLLATRDALALLRPGPHCCAHAHYSQENLGISARLDIFHLPFQ